MNDMDQFMISGIQQVGVGTENFNKTWNWLNEMFGADVKILEDDTVAERMLPYTGGQAQQRHASIVANLQGGGGFEIWQYSKRTPVPVGFEIAVGDLGIFAAKVACRDIAAFHRELSAKWTDLSTPATLPDGTPCFYVKDPFGNCFQLVRQDYLYLEQHRLTGGVAGALVGVTEMERSIDFYREVLGYDTIVYDRTGAFEDWAWMAGGAERYRRVLLKPSQARVGAFSGLLGADCIELVQALDRTPRKIYEGRFWGDPGFIQICYDITGMQALGRFCAGKGHPFTVDSCPDGQQFDMGDASGHFTYIEDPDGTLIEFVETHKIPVAKKLGWFIDMRRRDPRKPLPKFLFRMMGVVSRGRKREE
jgi:catechol 2,3-dioxygenase-like lactoylglutathione lyase family enzyme